MLTRATFNILSGFVARSEKAVTAVSLLCDRIKGLEYGSYSVADEAALAASFIESEISGGMIIDAGANRGDYTRAVVDSGVKIGKLIMIEPAPSLRGALQELVKGNRKLVLEPTAVGSTESRLPLFFDEAGTGLASLYQRDVSHVGRSMEQSVSVPVTTLDQIAKKHGINRIDYLKLDLEGHELEALKGARRLLSEQRIKALSFEFGGCNIDSRTFVKDFWHLLVRDHRFTFYRLVPGRRLLRLDRYSESLERFNWQNILACAPGITPQWQIVRYRA